MLDGTNRVAISFAFAFVVLLSGCSSEKKSSSLPDFHAGDPLTSYSQEITSPIHAFEVKVGETYTLDINVENTGTQPWYGHTATAPVLASYRWLDAKGTVLEIGTKRTPLTNLILKPGATEQVKLQVVAPPNPGSYILWVSMVQEGVNWFYWKGTKPLALQVTVD